MIKYALKCEVEHEFEAWFDSSGGYDDQARQGLIECPMCGSRQVTKAIMAPMVRTSKGADAPTQAQRMLAEMAYRIRRHVEETHDYVGGAFAQEARDIHQGLTPDRPIYGEATPAEVKALVADGVRVAAIPAVAPPPVEVKTEQKKLN
ncbi:MAG: DUF1178 family protein [Asticcacaulis sp.]